MTVELREDPTRPQDSDAASLSSAIIKRDLPELGRTSPDSLEDASAYWKQRLAGMPKVHTLPLDRLRPTVREPSFSTTCSQIGPETAAAFEHLYRSQNADLVAAIFAAYTLLLARHSGEQEIVVGMPTDAALGTLVLRGDLRRATTFVNLLQAGAVTIREAQAHASCLTFEDLTTLLGVDSSEGHAPICQLMLSVGAHLEEGAINPRSELTLQVAEASGCLNLAWTYATDLFDTASVQILDRHFQVLLDAVVAEPERDVWQLSLMDDGERRQVIEEWNATEVPCSRDLCIHQLFEAQAAQTPNSTAIVHEDHRLSYSELDARANRLAHHLRVLGVAANHRVAIALGRSVGLIVAEIAILKCGASYVPLDPEAPPSRLAWMLEDSGARLIVSEAEVACPPEIQRIDPDQESWLATGVDPPAAPVSSDSIAYVMYTSGSTGRPKGVLVPHRAIRRLILDNGFAEFTADDAVAFAANPAFDATTMEIWAPLLHGGRVVVIDQDVLLDPARFELILLSQRISVLWLTVGLFNRYAPLAGSALSALRYLIVGGDALDSRTVGRFLERHRPEHFINGYGPTEATTFALTHEVTTTPDERQRIPIGRPISNTQAYLLDSRGDPVPICVVGELYIGGEGVACGYLNRPDLTEERFVLNPFARNTAERMYRTGDLGRWLPNGTMEFFGRNDFQLKIRGFRVELGEIEARVLEHPEVREVVVLARQDEPGEKRLVAYFVGGSSVGAEALRSYLTASLPAYMVPAAYVRLDTLPLTPNGKVDRAALPQPNEAAFVHTGYEAPQGELEEALAGLWTTLLKAGRVGRRDNFFELGGHSLLAMRLLGSVRQRYGVEVSVRTLLAAPTLHEFAQRLAQAEATELPPIEHVADRASLPLSFAQQRLWFIDQLEGGSPHYHLPIRYGFEGELDVGALRRAIQAVVQRHESLRTVVAANGQQPVQRVLELTEVQFAQHDLRALPIEEQAAEADRLAAAEALAPFALDRDVMLRAMLLHLAEARYELLLTLHHIAADGWSLEVLMTELGSLYRAELGIPGYDLQPLPVQYADYAVWQRAWLQDDVLETLTRYWLQQLSDLPPVHGLKLDRPRQAQQDLTGSTYRSRVGQVTTSAFSRLCRAHQATLFMGLHAAFSLLLARHSGEQDIVVGTPIANREHSTIEPLIGFFVNTLVLRTSVAPTASFLDLLAESERIALDAYAYQQLPFEYVAERMQVRRSLSHSPLFQIMLALQNNNQVKLDLPDLVVTEQTVELGLASFELTLEVAETPQGLTLTWIYRRELFDDDSIVRMARHFEVLLDAIVASPHCEARRLPIVDKAERAHLLSMGNDTAVDFGRPACVHELFAEQVRRVPHSVAVVDGEMRLTYDELDRRANRCAHFLRAHGIGPDSVVGVFAERGINMIVAALATLKAGSAYLPIDTANPAARIGYMLDNAQSLIVLTHGSCSERLPPDRWKVVAVDFSGVFDAYPDTAPDTASLGLTPQHLAYVIYTSGSTGEPAGVMNTHAALSNLCRWSNSAFAVDENSRSTAIASIGFDASVWELWSVLLAGGCIVAVSDTTRATPALLGDLLHRERVTHCFMPTGLLEVMGETAVFNSTYLRVLFCGGEQLKRNHLPPQSAARLVNLYGPTEAAVIATSYEVARGSLPLIGKPIANVQAYVLDELLEPQPIGVAGELYLAGTGLARGYCRNEALTRSRFIPHPFSSDPDARVYNTGDMAIRHADGNLEFVGRKDQQVKLRGFRIEIGEIESRLSALPLVQAAAVLLREDVPGCKLLVGYVQLEEEAPSPVEAVAAILEALRRELPEYMVPGVMQVLRQFPLSPSGKVDRRRLPVPDALAEHDADAPPRTATEVHLAELWSQLLERQSIGIDTNFFEAGGHSLLVTRMVHVIADRMDMAISIKDVFQHPTVRGLAAAMGRQTQREVSVLPYEEGAEIPLSLCQFRVWYVEQMRAETNEHNIPIALTLKGALSASLLEEALNHVVARHDMLRTRFVLDQASPAQVIARELTLSLDYRDLTDLSTGPALPRARALMVQYATRPFNIQQLPLLTALLLRTADDEHRLQFNFHHLIFDGWSFTLFFDELMATYEALAGGYKAIAQAPKRHYGDFVYWQRSWIDSDEAQQQAAFWRAYLADCPEQLALPGLSRWLDGTRSSGNRQTVRIDVPTQRLLTAFAHSRRGTLFGVLYATFALLLGRLSGEDDLVIGISVSGRHIPGTQDVIGNFLNNLPVRTRFRLEGRFDDYIEAQINNIEEVLSNQDYPFEKILELSPHVRNPDATPLFQVFFNMLSLPRSAPSNLFEITAEEVAEIEPKFDLTLYVDDTANGIGLSCHRNGKLYSSDAISHLLDQYASLLNQVARDQSRACGAYSLRPDTELEGRRSLDPQRFWPGAVQDIFRRRALEEPQATAIIEHTQNWTYEEVLRLSEQLAGNLMLDGVGEGSVVGIVAARRACMVVGVLAVLQTGAAFSLLNPEYPVERVATLVDIIEPACVLFAGDSGMFDAELTRRIESMVRCDYLRAAKPSTQNRAAGTFVPAVVDPQQLACLTFTSGTTGIPKAVAGTHMGLAGYLAWVPQWLNISPADRFSMLSGLGHDPIQRDIFGPLCSGAALVIPSPDVIAPQLLAGWLQSNGITFVHMTPAMSQVLCATEETAFPTLRVAFLTGEKLHSDAVDTLLRFNCRMRILNSYGTTETQRAVTYFEVSGASIVEGVVPANECAPDAVIRVLNACGTPCGIGEIGDLYLESYALSKGYRNDPALTAKVLVELGGGLRRYRTGDVGCRIPGGLVMVLGRRDHQVNIRGFRIETGEIESQARRVEGVEDVAVVPIDRKNGDTALVAYVAADAAASRTADLQSRLAQHFKSTLPMHMVPSAIVVLKQLPLTPNGKLDRRALPQPSWSDSAGYVAPVIELERDLANIWAEVLHVERVGLDDNFFELGGHSMLLVLLLTRIRKNLGIPFKIGKLLPSTTVREQAQALAGLSA